MTLLLDTHALLWLVEGVAGVFSAQRLRQIDQAAQDNELYVQAFSFWEIAMLESKGRIRLSRECQAWCEGVAARRGLRVVPLAPSICVASTRLPEDFQADPADRIIVATARALGATLVTDDRRIHQYARRGHLKAVRLKSQGGDA